MPNPLYYLLLGLGPPGGGGGGGSDPNFANVVLLCHCEGTDGATTMVDSSNSGHTFTFADQAQIDTAQFKFGAASLNMDGSGGPQVTSADSADWHFGSGDFTIELFVRFASGFDVADRCMLSQYVSTSNQRSWILRWQDVGAGELSFVYSTDGTATTNVTGAFTPSANTWYYIAVTRSGADLKLWVDGSQVGSTHNISTNSLFNSNASLRLGTFAGPGESSTWGGWMDEIRITKGVARDVTSIPTAAFPDS